MKLQHNVIYTCWFQEVFVWFSVLSAPVSKETFVFLHCNYKDWHFSSTAPIKSVLSPADPETPWVSLRPSGTTAAVSFNYRFIHIWMWIIQWGRPSRAKQSQAEPSSAKQSQAEPSRAASLWTRGDDICPSRECMFEPIRVCVHFQAVLLVWCIV